MIDGDKYFVINANEIYHLFTLLDNDNSVDAMAYLDYILSTKTMKLSNPLGGVLYLD